MLIIRAVYSITEKPQSHLSLVGKRESAPDNDIGALIGVPGNREHWPQNSLEQGALDQKQPGTGNNGPKPAGNREQKAERSQEQGANS